MKLVMKHCQMIFLLRRFMRKERKKILISGVAGFIGYHFAKKVLQENYDVIGIDNINNYYDINLKLDRLADLEYHNINSLMGSKKNYFKFYKEDILNKKKIEEIFKKFQPDYVIQLAAEAGVRYSYDHPEAFIDSNLIGFYNILECCKKYKPINLIYASSSSVYGNIENKPSLESDNTDYPVSIYGATKKCNEILAHAYNQFYHIKMTGLRFYTVFGPFGRPDMAFGLFADAIINNKKIKVFNHGNMYRDFTYVDNIVNGIYLAMLKPQNYKIYNLGTGKIVKLSEMIDILENKFNKKVKKKYLPMQFGDVFTSYADIKLAEKELGYKPKVFIEEGITNFVNWYKDYYGKRQQNSSSGRDGFSRKQSSKRIKKTRIQ